MEGFVFTWWMWFLFGLLLMLAEFFTPGAFYQFFFGAGAVLVGLIGAFWPGMPLGLQLALFLVLSLGSLLVLRKPLKEKFGRGSEDHVDKIAGETAVAMEEIGVNDRGKAELRGTVWTARNVGAAAIAENQRCLVVRVDGLTLSVKGDSGEES
jgi:membrane protein implicated in regulation of membrane protease activity